MAAEIVDANGNSMWTAAFWKGAGERAIKTFAEAFLAVFGVSTVADVTGATLNAETWYLAAVSGAVAAALSVVMSLANTDFVAGKPAEVVAVPLTSTVTPTGAVIPDGSGEHRATEDAVLLTAEADALAARAAELRKGGVSA